MQSLRMETLLTLALSFNSSLWQTTISFWKHQISLVLSNYRASIWSSMLRTTHIYWQKSLLILQLKSRFMYKIWLIKYSNPPLMSYFSAVEGANRLSGSMRVIIEILLHVFTITAVSTTCALLSTLCSKVLKIFKFRSMISTTALSMESSSLLNIALTKMLLSELTILIAT